MKDSTVRGLLIFGIALPYYLALILLVLAPLFLGLPSAGYHEAFDKLLNAGTVPGGIIGYYIGRSGTHGPA